MGWYELILHAFGDSTELLYSDFVVVGLILGSVFLLLLLRRGTKGTKG
jgi:hypothetical protein